MAPEESNEAVFMCCMVRVGENFKGHKLISLENKDEVVFGRIPESDIYLQSTMVSRRHAILKHQEKSWVLIDNQSLNGTFINDQHVTPHVEHTLKDGDQLRIGVPEKPGQPPEFVWKFHSRLKVRRFKKNAKPLTESSNCKRERDEPITPDGHPSTSSKPPLKRLRPALESSPGQEFRKKLVEQEEEARKQLEAQQKLAEQQMKEQAEKLAEMELLLAEKDTMQQHMAEELKRKEQEMLAEMEAQKKKLEEERKQLEEQMRKDYESQLKEKEDSLMKRLTFEKEDLTEERKKVEAQLQQEMERKLEEKDKNLQAELERQKEKLDKVIEQKELEQRLLVSQLEETKSENVQHKDDALRVKEDLLTNFADLMETELQCSICNEMFVKATSLNCSHSFCQLCISQWMDVKKECPVCRAPITSHLKSIVLDSYIDRMVEHLSDDLKQARVLLVQQRKAEQAKIEASKAAAAVAMTATAGRRGRGGRRARGRRRGGPAARANEVITAVITDAIVLDSGSEADNLAVPEVGANITLSSDDESEESIGIRSDDDGFSDSSMEGDGYYGGYGSCFNCGRRGHWARGCPYR